MKRHASTVVFFFVTFLLGFFGVVYVSPERRLFDDSLIGLALLLWMLYLIPAVLFSLPIGILGWCRAKWLWWESGIFILPYWIWFALGLTNLAPKSLANFYEASWLGCLVPVAVLVRITTGQKIKRERAGLAITIALCLAAVLLYWIVPVLPEY